MHTAAVYAVYMLLAIVGLRLIFHRWVGTRSRYPFPPGPRGYPVLGNIGDIPPMPTWVTYRQWSSKYGSPILRLKIFGQNIIILNTLKAVSDLLEKRSAIYSDRPNWPMLNELCGFGWSFGNVHYGQEWRTRRKMIHSQFHSQVSGRLRPTEEKIAHRFLGRLLETPEEFMDHIRLHAGSQIGEMAFGLNVKNRNDPYLKVAEDAMGCARAVISAGSYLVDSFPFLKHMPAWFPGATFRRQAREWRVPVLKLLQVPFAEYKNRYALGDSPDCMATSLLDELKQHEEKDAPFTEEDVKAALATMYAAGSDTIYSSLASFILAMVLFLEVQSKAQAQIDAVCAGRLPTFADFGDLPYVQAIVNEVLRWNPVVPESQPHAVMEDDIYEGYFIPKGSIIVPNSWAILHDEEFYPDSSRFDPDRFLKDGTLDLNVLSPDVAAFGYGRRVCPGRFMARDSLWITIACTLAVFDIRPAKDQDGRPLMPAGEYDYGFLCHPKPFRCDIRLRSSQHEGLILSVLQNTDQM